LNEEEIIKIAKQTLSLESETLSEVSASIDSSFHKAISTIYNSKGRVVMTGIGKSALIAQKITATLNSTGTPALFMHAADAVHGDMGMLQDNDVLVCISKSGESPEIRVLLPFVKNLGNTIIGMVSKTDSFLAQNADISLFIPVSREADPNNLAPTASTTAQMAMGDAMAVALLAIKGFTPQDFAKYHPGGALGKQLYLRVSDLASRHPAPKVDLNADIRAIILEISSKRMGAAAVVDRDNHVLGIITDGDLRRMLEGEKDVSQLRAQDIMTPKPKSITSSSMAVKALSVMREHSISQLLVQDDGHYVGMVHLHDLIKEGLI
jgi:arabinose-5-phosphate isomerase